jgi:hypothetical protein
MFRLGLSRGEQLSILLSPRFGKATGCGRGSYKAASVSSILRLPTIASVKAITNESPGSVTAIGAFVIYIDN